jgi:serine/threonine-protein kinase RsbW
MRVEQIFPGRFESLAAISKFVKAMAQKAGLDEQAMYDVELAVDEAASNIIEHAYGGEGRGDIQCACDIQDNCLVITFEDTGKPFNPQQVPEPEIHTPLMERSSGGAGLYLMKKIMDEVRFEFKQGGNILTLVKRLA